MEVSVAELKFSRHQYSLHSNRESFYNQGLLQTQMAQQAGRVHRAVRHSIRGL